VSRHDPVIAPRGARSESRGARSESGGPRSESRGARSESNGPRSESRGARSEAGAARSESRGARSESRAARSESRAARSESGEARSESGEARSESGEARPDAAGLAAWRAFLNAHAAVISRIEADLVEAGLPPLSWYDVLWALYSAPERQLRMRELVDHVVLSRTGMTRLVDRIEAAGLLRREPVPDDRRGAFAVITDDGVEMLRRMWAVYAPGIQQLFVEPVGEDAPIVDAALRRAALEATTAGGASSAHR
jgi:DNA-binding MarR family transcriptional regulator